MKKSACLFSLLILVYVPVFCCLSLVCFAADSDIISEYLDNVLKLNSALKLDNVLKLDNTLRLKEAGDIDGAISSIQRTLATDFFKKELKSKADDGGMHTKEYLQMLILCLKGDKITYTAIIKHITSIVKKTKKLFFEIADELKAGKFSKNTASSINEMKLQISREMVTHSFCVSPKGYEKIYDVIQAALFWYSKAWKNLYLYASEQTDEKDGIGVDALLCFQKGNEFFSQAGTLMLAIPK